MGTSLATLLMMALLIIGASVLAETSFGAVDTLSGTWKEMEVRSAAAARTRIRVVDTDLTGQSLTVTVLNEGSEPIAAFAEWDVIAQYYQANGTYWIERLTFVNAGPLDTYEWTVEGLYLNAATSQAEAHQPGILDPGEQLVLEAELSPAPRPSGDNMLVIATGNGVTTSTPF